MPYTQSGKQYVRRGDGLPEVGWRNPRPAYVVSEMDMAKLLGAMAVLFHLDGCTKDWCEQCNPMRQVWWDLYNGCSRELRIAVAEGLSEQSIQLPPGFYDEQPLT